MICTPHHTRCYSLCLFISCLLLLVAGCQDKLADQPFTVGEIHVIHPASVDGLQAYFQALGYDWDNVAEGVPPIIIEKLPDDFGKGLDTSERKQTFFMSLLPMVLLANNSIAQDRNELLSLLNRFKGTHTLEPEEQEWIKQLTREYGLRGDPLTDHRTRRILLRRVDTIPPSLALAQAANESGWGRSRFALEGNNLFGQWTFTPGTGIVPKNRPPGATYEVRRFKSLDDSIKSYLMNLNTHSAYQDLRLVRQRLREKGLPVTGKSLAEGLERYSTRGDAYIREIRAMIDHNNLSAINRARLSYDIPQKTESFGPSGGGLLSSRYQINSKPVKTAVTPIVD